MSKGFDFYHKWLSIPPSEQPPNHYRLLGLEQFESDSDVISAAADRQMSHVQTYKNGPQAALSQKLLNEIATAKLCLLKPQKKEVYDAQLRQRACGKQASSTPAPALPALSPPPMPASRSSPLPPPPIPAPPTIDELDSAPRQPTLGAKAVLAAGSILILLLIVAIVAVLKSGHGSESTTSGSSSSSSTTHDGATDGTLATNNNGKTGEPTVPPTIDSIPANSGHANNRDKSKPPVDRADSHVKSPETTATNIKPDSAKNPDPVPTIPADKSSTKPQAVDANINPPRDPSKTQPDTGSRKKLLVPDDRAQAAAAKQYSAAFAESTPQTVLEKSKEITDGPLVYVALNKALETAVGRGDVALVGQIVDELSRRFTVDTVPLRAKAYIDLRRHVAATPAWETLADSTLALIDEAIAADRLDLSLPLAETSLIAARKSGNLELIRKVTLRVLLLQQPGRGKKTEVENPGSGKQSLDHAARRGQAA